MHREMRRVFVLGGHITPFLGKGHPSFSKDRTRNPTLEDHIAAAVKGALQSTGVQGKEVDRIWVGNFAGELFANQGHLGAGAVGADPDLLYKPSMRVEGACASGGLAFEAGVQSIRAGSDVVLVVGAEVQTTVPTGTGGDFLARAGHYRTERGVEEHMWPHVFASRTRAYRERYPHVSEEDIDRASVKAYANAKKNPLAHKHTAKPVTLDSCRTAPRFQLKDPSLGAFLKMTDCSQVSDGAAALVMVSEEGLRKLHKDVAAAIEVLAVGQSTGNLYAKPADLSRLDTVADAARKAYEMSGVSPKDIQVAEVHDCFTIVELLMYEALGFAKPGEAAKLLRERQTDIDGRLPVNTGGGLVGFGHPVGATGVKQVLEVYRQMKGLCGEYQMPRRPQLGLMANMGGNDKTAVVAILKNTEPALRASL